MVMNMAVRKHKLTNSTEYGDTTQSAFKDEAQHEEEASVEEQTLNHVNSPLEKMYVSSKGCLLLGQDGSTLGLFFKPKSNYFPFILVHPHHIKCLTHVQLLTTRRG